MKSKITVRDMAVFAMLGTIMFITKTAMEFLPNIHPLAMLTVAYTLVYRSRALIPLYIYVLLNGLFAGFNVWWMPYLYIWTLLWVAAMLIPKEASPVKKGIFATVICAAHGLLFGILYAPAQMLMFHLTFRAAVTWIIAGFPYDLLHCVGNIVISVLTVPIVKVLTRLEDKKSRIN